MENYVIKKILSNNVVLVEKENQNYILVGKGIGFGKKKGIVLENPEIIDEKFISLKGLSENEYESFLSQVDPKIIELVEEIMVMVKNELGEGLNPNVHVGLIDHINFAIKRLTEGIEIVNPFLLETKLLYPAEYNLAEKAVSILKENLKIRIPEAEVGFLALHIYGGRGNKSKKEALESSKMMNTIISYTEKKLNIHIDKYSFDYKRFIMHLRGVIDRVLNHKTIENILLSKVKEELMIEFKVAYDVSKIIEKTLKVKIPESETGYIALHLHRLNSQRCK
ncbi:BglG family transcription antiterminator [Crassaminicella profunda]|uniref:BglG family transcription antiterminator n=1 Tax=Crassaminicella profunda TaxID=1286698 RepID=UPI001CA70A03|nr:PRD domain-containing protein [Crassaminicella profunda]QZY55826.1 PRD domain-containing protein [Crassaminicella profunda]